MKQAVILAAGRGRRLSSVTNGIPKCLVRVGGSTLIERQLRLLDDVGVKNVAVVIGYRCDDVRSVIGNRCEFIVNERWGVTNSLYSLWLARHWVSDSLILMNSDVLAHPDIYHRVLARLGNALAYDSSSGSDDEHMKVSLDGDQVHSLGKQIPSSSVDGENVGILQFDSVGRRLLFEAADRMVLAGHEQQWAPAAVDSVAKQAPVRAVDIAGLPWTEIDFPADLQAAEEDISPTITHGRWCRADGVAILGGPRQVNGQDVAGIRQARAYR